MRLLGKSREALALLGCLAALASCRGRDRVAPAEREKGILAPPSVAPSVAPSAAPSAAPSTGGEVTLRLTSTRKVEQLIGDVDRETGKPTRNRTEERYGLKGTDLGYSFEHRGRVLFLFGDTLGKGGGDSFAWSTSTDPHSGLALQFFSNKPGSYVQIRPEGIRMGGFEVPVSGVSLGGQAYVVLKTNHTEGAFTEISVLTKLIEPDLRFSRVRELSRLPEGKFIKMSIHEEPSGTAGLPPGGPWLLLFGTGKMRASDPYLALVPASSLETGRGTRYFSGIVGGAARWAETEAEARPLFSHPTMMDLSVTWSADLKLWLMVYDSREGSAEERGIVLRHSRSPTGPWSSAQRLFSPKEGYGRFIHDASHPDPRLAGPMISAEKRQEPEKFNGAAYAPYVVERFTRLQGSTLSLYYVLSTWNPYVVVLMESQLAVSR